MAFWVAMIVGGLFAVAAIESGFCRSWITLFNLVLAAYLAVFLTPLAAAAVPAAASNAFGYTLTFLAIGGGTFAIGYWLAALCLTKEGRVEFPRALETLGAGILGFLSGFLVFSFFALALLLTPWSQSDFCKNYGLDKGALESNREYVIFWCERINTIVAAWDHPRSAEQAVKVLFAGAGLRKPEAAAADSPTAPVRPPARRSTSGPRLREIAPPPPVTDDPAR